MRECEQLSEYFNTSEIIMRDYWEGEKYYKINGDVAHSYDLWQY